jgi:hypothetical protein
MSMIDDKREKNPRKRYPHNTLNFNVINVIIHNSLWILTDSSHSCIFIKGLNFQSSSLI